MLLKAQFMFHYNVHLCQIFFLVLTRAGIHVSLHPVQPLAQGVYSAVPHHHFTGYLSKDQAGAWSGL
jgi:hypothetical protein